MDFMKVLDQTVREIKREVNLKVLKVPEIEQKVLDATSDEPWGPHGSALAEIAQETKKFTECQMIMNTLWTRLADTGANWRHAYKALAVIEYLIGNGSERAVDDIIEHTLQISSLTGFEFVEPNGKDMGINVRKKAETISALLNDREKIKVARDKAAATRDKYFGLSSSGVTYKSSAASIGSNNFNQYDRFGGRSGLKEGERFRDGYKDNDRHGDERKNDHANEADGKKSKDQVAHHIRIKTSSNSKIPSTQNSESVSKSGSPQISNSEDDFDDFDPRGSSIAGPVSGSPEKVDLFADSLFIDLVDEPAPAFATTSAATPTVETDLFADATFISAPPSTEVKEVDLFAHQSAPAASVPSKTNLFDLPDPPPSAVIKPVKSRSTNSSDFDPFSAIPLTSAPATMPPQSETTKSSSFDPFSAVPLNTFDNSDFGAFTSHTGSMNSESSQDRERKDLDSIGSQTLSVISKPQKNSFQVKSGIWADSLSRGLIDLNITAPKKVSLADVGIVGSLEDPSEEKEMNLPSSMYMGRAMGTGAGLSWSAFPPSTATGGSGTATGGSGNFSSQQQQWGNFK